MLGSRTDNLGRDVDWYDVLVATGKAPADHVLPHTTECPACRKHTLIVQRDPGNPVLSGSEAVPAVVDTATWHFCKSCHWAGDGIEHAATYWDLPLDVALAKLEAAGVVSCHHASTRFQMYRKQCVDQRIAAVAFFNKSRERLVAGRSAAVRDIFSKFGIFVDSNDMCERGIGRLVGAATKDEIEQFFGTNGKGITRTLPGKGWDDVVVAPFYDAPGRIRGFLLIGRQGGPDDIVFKRAATVGVVKGLAEAGLFGHELLYRDTVPVGHNGAAFIFDSVPLAMKLQNRHLRNALEPLPIMAWFDGVGAPRTPTKTSLTWGLLPQRRYVFCPTMPDARVFEHASLVDGWVADVRTQDLSQYFDDNPSQLLTSRLDACARPWYEMLNRSILELDVADLENFLAPLPPDQLGRLLERCSVTARNKVASVVESFVPKRTVRLHSSTVCEHSNTWRIANAKGVEEPLCDAILRVDKTIYVARDDATYYQGRILYNNEEIAFTEPLAAMDRDPGRWLHHYMIARGKGDVWISPSWSTRLLAVAKQFQPPKLISGAACVGWDHGTGQFLFPGFSVGQASDTLLPLVDTGDTPAKICEPPELLTAEDVAAITMLQPYSAALWATIGCIVSNTTAPVVGTEAMGIALTGDGATRVGICAAQWLGCLETATAAAFDNRHNWPLIIGPNAKGVIEWAGSRPKNHIVRMSSAAAQAARALGFWLVIEDTEPLVLPYALKAPLARLMSAYLQDLCNRGFVMQTSSVSHVERTLDDLMQFVESRGGRAAAPRRAFKVVQLAGTPEDTADAVGRLFSKLLRRGLLSVVRDGFTTKSPDDCGFVLLPDNRVFIAKTAINHELSRLKAPLLDIYEVTQALAGVGVLVGEDTYRESCGWIVTEEWLTKVMAADDAPQLQVFGA